MNEIRQYEGEEVVQRVKEIMVENEQYYTLIYKFVSENDLEHKFYQFLLKHIQNETNSFNFLDLEHIALDYNGYEDNQHIKEVSTQCSNY